uniref:HMG box domain-containing protein n=1 Tax=Glossina austeni TaxID=7395 RepID=A0A1A9UUZ5_GLOAU
MTAWKRCVEVCIFQWTMVDKEKKRFHEMAEKDKARYEMEMQNYVPPKGTVVGRGKKRKQPKDPNAPKRDIAKELGRKWADVEPEVKQKYELMAEKDKARYERQYTTALVFESKFLYNKT